jgi:hypothetical protein
MFEHDALARMIAESRRGAGTETNFHLTQSGFIFDQTPRKSCFVVSAVGFGREAQFCADLCGSSVNVIYAKSKFEADKCQKIQR